MNETELAWITYSLWFVIGLLVYLYEQNEIIIKNKTIKKIQIKVSKIYAKMNVLYNVKFMMLLLILYIFIPPLFIESFLTSIFGEAYGVCFRDEICSYSLVSLLIHLFITAILVCLFINKKYVQHYSHIYKAKKYNSF